MSRRVNNFFKKAITFRKFYEAYYRAAKLKHKNKEIIEFEMNLAVNLYSLMKDVYRGTYKPGFYRKFTVYEPKERIIMALPFRDRVLHQWFVEEFVKPIFLPKLINNTFACIPGRGLHRGS